MSWKLANAVAEKQIGEAKLLAIVVALHCFQDSMTCHPSISRLAKLCEISERAAYRQLKKLKRVGYASVKRRQHLPALITLHLDAMPNLRPDAGDRSESSRPDTGDNPDLPLVTLRPATGGKRNKEEKVLKRLEAKGKPSVPDWVPAVQWEAFVEMRRKMGLPLTDRAIVLIVNKLDKLRHEGHDPGALLDLAVERGWRSVFPPKKANGEIYVNKAEQRQADNLRACDGAKAAILAGR